MNTNTPPNTTKLLSYQLHNRVGTLTLHAGKAHALSLTLIRELHRQIATAADDPAVGALVIHGPGSIFCAGHDLKEIKRHRADSDHGAAYLRELFEACSEMMQCLSNCPKPTLARVEGIATAAGLQLVASCDLAFASNAARVCLPGVNNNGFCSTPAVTVSRVIAKRHLMELMLSGEVFDAQWALRVGLFNRVVDDAELPALCDRFAATLAQRNTPVIERGKTALNEHLEMPIAQAYIHATEAMLDHFMDPRRIDEESRSPF